MPSSPRSTPRIVDQGCDQARRRARGRRSPSRGSHDLERARKALTVALAVPAARAGHRATTCGPRAAALEDLLSRETFFRDLPAIEQHTRRIEAEYERRLEQALGSRSQTTPRPARAWSRRRAGPTSTSRAAAASPQPFQRGNARAMRIATSDPAAPRGPRRLRGPPAAAQSTEVRRLLDGDRVVTRQRGAATSRVASRRRSSSTPHSKASARNVRGSIGAGKKIIVQ